MQAIAPTQQWRWLLFNAQGRDDALPCRAATASAENRSEGAGAGIVAGTRQSRQLATALVVAGFSTFGLLYDCQPLLPLFARTFDVNAAGASLTVSLSTGAMAIAFIPAGVLSDRVGRRPVMIASLFASALMTFLSSMLPGWPALLAARALIGVALAGVPSVAMAYVAEEVQPSSVGAMMGLYVSGTAIGGMTGRLGMTFLSHVAGWRLAMMAMGAAGLLAGIVFVRCAPPSRAFTASRHDRRTLLAAMVRLVSDRVLALLYLAGFLLMGAFVTVYNYAGFRLEAPPYGLSQLEVGSIFLLYLLGSYSSAWFGGLAGRRGRAGLFWLPVAAMLGGVALTGVQPLPLVITGIAVVTAAFFAAHSTASSWVGARAERDRAQAAALYLLFYYLGSSLLGSLGGVAWSWRGWTGVSTYCVALIALALAIALRLRSARPAGV
jgi:MFS transporter, YNFM family, putative membrane transport protein